MKRQRYRYRDDEKPLEPTQTVVTLIGLGPLGTRVSELLVREGFAVRLIDTGDVDYHDLYGCGLIDTEDIGESCVGAVKSRLKKIHPGCVVKAFEEHVKDNTSYLLQGDIYLSFVGEKRANHVVREAALSSETPWVSLFLTSGELVVTQTPTEYELEEGVDPASTCKAAGIVLQCFSEWVLEGVVSRRFDLSGD